MSVSTKNTPSSRLPRIGAIGIALAGGLLLAGQAAAIQPVAISAGDHLLLSRYFSSEESGRYELDILTLETGTSRGTIALPRRMATASGSMDFKKR